MKKLFLTATMCSMITAFATGCGNNDSKEEESIEDIMKSLEELSDSEILSMGIVQAPDISISIDDNGEEKFLTQDIMKQLAIIDSELNDYNNNVNLWRGVYFLDSINLLGIDEFHSLIIEGNNINGEPVVQEYTYSMASYSMLAYGVDGANIEDNNINIIILDNSVINAENWVYDVQNITVNYDKPDDFFDINDLDLSNIEFVVEDDEETSEESEVIEESVEEPATIEEPTETE